MVEKGTKSLGIIVKIQNKKLKRYFRKVVWKYQKDENSKQTTRDILRIYLDGATVSDRDKQVAIHSISCL